MIIHDILIYILSQCKIKKNPSYPFRQKEKKTMEGIINSRFLTKTQFSYNNIRLFLFLPFLFYLNLLSLQEASGHSPQILDN
jgi:hypothetical protein